MASKTRTKERVDGLGRKLIQFSVLSYLSPPRKIMVRARVRAIRGERVRVR